MTPKNYGLLIEPIQIGTDYVLGGHGDLDGEALQPDGQWDNYLPKDEVQDLNGIEPFACVSFSALNAVEILIERQFGEKRNYSDRFLAAVSGTAASKGNSLQKVCQALRDQGATLQDAWPFDRTIDTFEKFYAPVPNALVQLALEFKAEFDYQHEYVPCNPSALKEALTKSPLNLATFAWAKNGDGLYYVPAGAQANHSPVLYGYVEGEYWKIFDSYDSTHKRMAWNTQFAQAKRHKLTRQVAAESWWKKFLYFMGLIAKETPTAYAPATPPSPVMEEPAKEPEPVVTTPPATTSRLEAFCTSIKKHEGWYAGSRSQRNNNPGNCRYSKVGYASVYGKVGKDAQGFAVFRDYTTGWLYLKNLVKVKIKAHPTWSIERFFADEEEGYAPASDGNDPIRYAKIASEACGLKPTDPVSKVL